MPFKPIVPLSESSGGAFGVPGGYVVQGVLQRAGAKNQNGRIYPKSILERECKRYQQEYIQQHRALGELDHPESSIVNLNNVSHNVLKIWWKGDDLCGAVQILETPSGKILKELFILFKSQYPPKIKPTINATVKINMNKFLANLKQ